MATTIRVRIHKHCVPNINDRCVQCRGRRISRKKKRVCPMYSLSKEKGRAMEFEAVMSAATLQEN